MKLIIDTNIIISALIKTGKNLELIFDDRIKLFAPEFLLKEIKKNKELIIIKTELGDLELEFVLKKIEKKIIFINEKEYFLEIKNMINICPDEKDIDYFALANYLKINIWSNEKRLRKQKLIKILNTQEIKEKLEKGCIPRVRQHLL